jgi:ankyrin repeat protein
LLFVAVHWAVDRGHKAMVEYLLNLGMESCLGAFASISQNLSAGLCDGASSNAIPPAGADIDARDSEESTPV